jgi:hypothetical protein
MFSIRKKNNPQKAYKAYLTQDIGGNQIQATQLLLLNAHRVTNQDIPDILDYINNVAGYHPITYKATNVIGKTYPVFEVTDTDVQKQKMKAIRAANKVVSAGYSKKDVTDKVWKYKYLLPALESEYFERNVGDDKEITKLRQVKAID